MELIITPLEKALSSLNEALLEYNKDIKNLFVRDSCIQRFEYSYELAWKMLRRYLRITEASNIEIEELNFQSLIRLGSDKGLLKNGWDQWKIYRETRNITSHAYDETKAQEIIKYIPSFYADALYLLNKLKTKNA